tara:strand:- start:111 stop:299 length:189 start_codon:yes stop_codon:yes gene_type:complete
MSERVDSEHQTHQLTFVENINKAKVTGQSWTKKIYNHSSSGDFEIKEQENTAQIEVDLRKIE